jgi:hypothetical protein
VLHRLVPIILQLNFLPLKLCQYARKEYQFASAFVSFSFLLQMLFSLTFNFGVLFFFLQKCATSSGLFKKVWFASFG